jgi:hypothetical protein
MKSVKLPWGKSATNENGPYPISGMTNEMTRPFSSIKLQTWSKTCKIRGKVAVLSQSVTAVVVVIAVKGIKEQRLLIED